MPAYQELIHSDNVIRYPRINRLLNKLVKKCRDTKASDNCIGCLGFDRCHRNAAPTISIDAIQPEHEQAMIEI